MTDMTTYTYTVDGVEDGNEDLLDILGGCLTQKTPERKGVRSQFEDSASPATKALAIKNVNAMFSPEKPEDDTDFVIKSLRFAAKPFTEPKLVCVLADCKRTAIGHRFKDAKGVYYLCAFHHPAPIPMQTKVEHGCFQAGCVRRQRALRCPEHTAIEVTQDRPTEF